MATKQKTGNNNPQQRIAPSGDIVMITPADGTALKFFTKGIIMSTGNDGTLAAVNSNGEDITIPTGTLITGVVYPFQLKEIKNTGTTATAVVCLF